MNERPGPVKRALLSLENSWCNFWSSTKDTLVNTFDMTKDGDEQTNVYVDNSTVEERAEATNNVLKAMQAKLQPELEGVSPENDMN